MGKDDGKKGLKGGKGDNAGAQVSQHRDHSARNRQKAKSSGHVFHAVLAWPGPC